MGLYDDENAGVAGGDLPEEAYWEARATYEQLEAALKTEQPWNAIADWLPRAIAKFDAVLKDYPNHADVLAWKAKANGIDAKIDPKYNKDWKPGFPWKQEGFRKGWAELHMLRYLRANNAPGLSEPDWKKVYFAARRVHSGWDGIHDTHEWPEEARKLVEAGRAEAERLKAEAHPKM